MIKSYPHGITLRLDPELPFPDLLEETAEQFRQNRKFFGNARLALRTEGRSLTPEEEDELVSVILRESDLQISCVLLTEGEQDTLFIRALRQEGLLPGDPRPDLRLFNVRQGSLEPGKSLHVERSLLMFGDIPESSELSCDGSVILLGTLTGRLICGGPFAYVRQLNSRKITVAGMAPREKKSGLRSLFRSRRDCLLVADGQELQRLSTEDFSAWLAGESGNLFGCRPTEEELL